MIRQTSKKNNSLASFFSNKKNLPTIILAIFVAIVALFFCVTMVNQSADIKRMQIQRDELQIKLDEQVNDNEQLQAVLDSDSKDDYIEQKAREKGYVKANEIVFYDISSSE